MSIIQINQFFVYDFPFLHRYCLKQIYQQNHIRFYFLKNVVQEMSFETAGENYRIKNDDT